VPVEADGSARFIVPAHKPILFQVLDKDGFAYQTMRSLTYVQPGERTSCVGCHEHRMSAPPKTSRIPLALRRPPSAIDPGELGGEPFSFVRVVQPVLDTHCVKCHSGPEPKKGVDLTGTPHNGFTKSYWSLCGNPDDFNGAKTNPQNAAVALVPRFGMRNQVQVTPPGGLYGALGSRLVKMLREGHNKVKLNDSDLRRLAAWIDLNAIFYGVYDPAEQAKQLAGRPIAMPAIQ
jgi:cytochrome c553